jgi:hypothetical protein
VIDRDQLILEKQLARKDDAPVFPGTSSAESASFHFASLLD